MKYYIDITLLGDTEISLGFIWQKIYTQMHLVLVEHKNNDGLSKIGFSFPHYMQKFPLGDTLRLLALTKKELKSLKLEERLENFLDYVVIGKLQEVPDDIKAYATFSRKQFKSNPTRLARRYAKRHNKTLAEALDLYRDMSAKESNLPFVMLKSSSSNQQIRIFIEKNIKEISIKGLFSAYGLSSTATVPLF